MTAQPFTEYNHRKWNIIAAVALVGTGLLWLWFLLEVRGQYEDAWITYKYAFNLIDGKGFVFNVGERVLGTTTPLYTLILAAFGFIFGKSAIPIMSWIIGYSAGLGALWATYRGLINSKLHPIAGISAIILFGLHIDVVEIFLHGMETSLVIFLMSMSFMFFSKGKTTASALFAGLLVLTRIDGLIFAGVLFIAIIISEKRIPWRRILVFLVVTLPWFIFSMIYFGDFLPHSIRAKTVIKGIVPELFSRFNLKWYSGMSGYFFNRTFPFVLVCVLCAIAIFYIFRRKKYITLLPIGFGISYSAAYFFGRAPFFNWYRIPCEWAYLTTAGVGIFALLGLVYPSKKPKKKAGLLRKALAIILFAIPITYFGISNVKTMIEKAPKMRRFQENEEQCRRALGEWLSENTPLNATVAMEAIGYQGAFANRHIVDLAGLITPKFVEITRDCETNAESFFMMMTQMKPDYIVLRTYELQYNRHFHGGPLFATQKEADWMMTHYREVKRFTAPHVDLWTKNSYVSILKRGNYQPTIVEGKQTQ